MNRHRREGLHGLKEGLHLELKLGDLVHTTGPELELKKSMLLTHVDEP